MDGCREPDQEPAPDDVDDACPEPAAGPAPDDVDDVCPGAGRRVDQPGPFVADACRHRSTRRGPDHAPSSTCTFPRRRCRPAAGIARVEDIGPVLLTRLRDLVGETTQILLKPVIDLNDVPPPVDSYEIPDIDPGASAAAAAGRCVPLRRRRHPPDGSGPHHLLRAARAGRAAGPNRGRKARTVGPLPPPGDNPRWLAGPTTRTRHLDMAITGATDLSDQHQRHPPARALELRPTDLARRQSPPPAPPDRPEPAPADDNANESRAEQIARAHLEAYILAT